MTVLTDRQRKAIAGLFYKRGKTIKRYAKKRPFGTDAYIAYEAKTLALNPYRMPSEFVLLFNEGQQAFLFEMEELWQRLYTKGLEHERRQAEAEVREEIMS
jgi:hypothetical protein